MPAFARVLLVAVLAVTALELSAGSAFAQTRRSAQARREWHGWQNLAVDGATVAVVMTSIALVNADVGDRETNIWVGFSGTIAFALGSPIVDWYHGHVGLGLGSLGLRVVAGGMLAFGAIDHALSCESEDEEGLPCSEGYGWYVGSALLGIVAIALDSGLDREPATSQDASLPIALSVRRDGALLSWRGVL